MDSKVHGEQAHLRAVIDSLRSDIARHEAELAQLAKTLKDEQRDVARYERGMWARLYDAFADRTARFTKEQQEAAIAEVRYRETASACERLRAYAQELQGRLEAISAGSPPSTTDAKQAEALASLDAQQRALDEATLAGLRAQAALSRLGAVLASAGSWSDDDVETESFWESWAKRNQLEEAHGIVGEAQAALTVFQRELADIHTRLASDVVELAEGDRFLDVWFANIFSDHGVQERIAAAQQTLSRITEEVGVRLAEVRRREAEIAALRAGAAR